MVFLSLITAICLAVSKQKKLKFMFLGLTVFLVVGSLSPQITDTVGVVVTTVTGIIVLIVPVLAVGAALLTVIIFGVHNLAVKVKNSSAKKPASREEYWNISDLPSE